MHSNLVKVETSFVGRKEYKALQHFNGAHDEKYYVNATDPHSLEQKCLKKFATYRA